MKVAFLNPPWWEGQLTREVRRGIRAGSRWPMTVPLDCAYTPFPFHLAYAASYTAAGGHEVMLRDSVARRENYRDWFCAVRDWQPDLIVLETSTPSWENDRKVIEGLAYWQVGKVMVVGPPMHSPTARRRALAQPGVLAVAEGEYERAVRGCADALVDGIATPGQEWKPSLLDEREMNEAPGPLLSPEETELYQDAEYLTPGAGPQLQAWSSRGCPFQCGFCVWPQAMTQNRVRLYGRERLFSTLREGLLGTSRRAVYFDDDTFNLTARHVEVVCCVMEDLADQFGQPIPWSAMCRIDTLREEDWRMMAESGCQGIKFGVECSSDRIRNAEMRKHLDLADVRRFLPVLRDMGIRAHGTFMLGWPGETHEEIQDTKRLIQECYALGMTSHQESGAAAHEGTALWERGHRASDGQRAREGIAWR